MFESDLSDRLLSTKIKKPFGYLPGGFWYSKDIVAKLHAKKMPNWLIDEDSQKQSNDIKKHHLPDFSPLLNLAV